MTVLTEARTDSLWHALGVELPESCRAHHCWADQCPAGSHDAAESEVA